MFFEAGVMFTLAFSLAGTAVKASGTDAQDGPVDLGFARTGTEWRLPQQAENRFRVAKALLAEDLRLMRSRHFLFTLKACCAIMSIDFFDGLETT